MSIVTSLIPELDEIIRNGDPKRRAEAAAPDRRIVPAGGGEFPARSRRSVRRRPDQSRSARRNCRARRSGRTAVGPCQCATRAGRQLAHEDEISIAGPLLRRSPVIDERALIEIARMKGQGHLLAMSERPRLSPDLDRRHRAPRRPRRGQARCRQCRRGSFRRPDIRALIKRAGQDGVLTLTVGQRDDLSAQLKDLLAGRSTSSAVVCSRWSSPSGRPRSSRR